MPSDQERTDWCRALPSFRRRLDRQHGKRWKVEYRNEAPFGMVARLSFYDAELGEWIYREAGVTETWEGISIFEAAFLEVAVSTWGIGRDDTVPADPIPVSGGSPEPDVAATSTEVASPQPLASRPTPEPCEPTKPTSSPPEAATIKPNRQFIPPRNPSKRWPYINQLQKHFGVSIWGQVNAICGEKGFETKANQWSESQYYAVLESLFEFLRGLAGYKGELEGVELPIKAGAKPEPEIGATKAKLSPEEEEAKKRRGAIKREIMQTVDMTLLATTEQPPTLDQTHDEVKRLSALCHPQAAFMESLRDCTDMDWLEKTYAEARKNLTNLQRKRDGEAGIKTEDSSIPF